MAQGQSGVRQPTLEQRMEGGEGGRGKAVPGTGSGSRVWGAVRTLVGLAQGGVRRDWMVWTL